MIEEGASRCPIPRFWEQGCSEEAVTARHRWVEERTAKTLAQVGAFGFPTEEMRRNIENPLGAAQVLLGVAGPILAHGDHSDSVFFVPMATTEVALVRAYERGPAAITRAGGAQVQL